MNFYFPELAQLDIALYTCTVKEEVVKFEIFKPKYPAYHVIVQMFNSIGSQALWNQIKYHIRQFYLIRSDLDWYQDSIAKLSCFELHYS